MAAKLSDKGHMQEWARRLRVAVKRPAADIPEKEAQAAEPERAQAAPQQEGEELLYFYLAGCPFCVRATQYLEQLLEEHPEFQAIPIRRIEERREAALANSYDYYRVPCFFLNGEKLHEGAADKEDILRVLEQAQAAIPAKKALLEQGPRARRTRRRARL